MEISNKKEKNPKEGRWRGGIFIPPWARKAQGTGEWSVISLKRCYQVLVSQLIARFIREEEAPLSYKRDRVLQPKRHLDGARSIACDPFRG
jgi:hypothetical protein